MSWIDILNINLNGIKLMPNCGKNFVNIKKEKILPIILKEKQKKYKIPKDFLSNEETIKMLHYIFIDRERLYVKYNEKKIFLKYKLSDKLSFYFDKIKIKVSFKDNNGKLLSILKFENNIRIDFNILKKWKKIIESYLYDIEDTCKLFYQLNNYEFEVEEDSDDSFLEEEEYDFDEYQKDFEERYYDEEDEDEDIKLNKFDLNDNTIFFQKNQKKSL